MPLGEYERIKRCSLPMGGRMQDEMCQQGRLSRPCRGYPAPVAGAVTACGDIVRAEGGEIGEFALTPLEVGGEGLFHLQEIAGGGGAPREHLHGAANDHAGVGEGPGSLRGGSARLAHRGAAAEEHRMRRYSCRR